jgi:hypothetical protein
MVCANRRCTSKLLLFLLALLLAGAIINVAVAWACALHASWPATTENWVDSTVSESWPIFAPSDWPAGPRKTSVETSFVTISRHYHVQNVDEKLDLHTFERYDFGLPVRSLGTEAWSEEVQEGVPSIVTHESHGRRGFWRPRIAHGRGFQLLPLLPIWPGFAINTIFYAAIVWGLFAVPGAVRCRLRRKRGQCAVCGYSLRGTPHNEKCSECGAAVRQS